MSKYQIVILLEVFCFMDFVILFYVLVKHLLFPLCSIHFFPLPLLGSYTHLLYLVLSYS
jgi:hypothetical protein